MNHRLHTATTSSSASAAAHAGQPAAALWRAAALCLVILVAGCSAGGGAGDATSPSSSTSSTSTPEVAPAGPAEVVRPSAELIVFDAPDSSGASRTIPATTPFGTPTALLVTDRTDGWVQVLVPGRPIGATAWVPADGLEIQTITSELRIDLEARTLTLVEDGVEVLTTPVAIGSPEAPTPTGRFSITDKLQSPDPSGAYGPFALGLSARSEVITDFAGGDGQIGIHGTDDPDSIGTNVSHGCIRVPNEIIEELNRRLPLGTPVVVS